MEQEKKKNGLYVASLVLGITSLILAIFPFVGFIIGIVALIISIVALRKINKNNEKNSMATVGFVLSIIGFIISAIITICIIIMLMGVYFYAYSELAEIYEETKYAVSARELCDIVRDYNITIPEKNIEILKEQLL